MDDQNIELIDNRILSVVKSIFCVALSLYLRALQLTISVKHNPAPNSLHSIRKG